MSRTIRKAYTKSKKFDKTCRCNGGCEYCKSNRIHKYNKEKDKINLKLKEYKFID